MSQINLFEVLNERFYLQEPVKLFEAFARRGMSNYGIQTLGH